MNRSPAFREDRVEVLHALNRGPSTTHPNPT
jgi:hypothetical protein